MLWQYCSNHYAAGWNISVILIIEEMSKTVGEIEHHCIDLVRQMQNLKFFFCCYKKITVASLVQKKFNQSSIKYSVAFYWLLCKFQVHWSIL